MPKHWLYHIALFIPMISGILVYHTGFVEWLWYQGHEQGYYTLAGLRENPLFKEFMGGWALPIFIVIIGGWWHIDEHADHGDQFLLLPLLFVPVAIIVHCVSTMTFQPSVLYYYPLLIIPFGYLYILCWVVCVWVFEKLHIVM
jgi:hypothetical protein